MADRFLSLKEGAKRTDLANTQSTRVKIDLPDGMSSEKLLNRRHSTSITANLIESIPSKLQL